MEQETPDIIKTATKLMSELDQRSEESNTLGLDKFMEFHPLFLLDGKDMVSENEYYNLANKWFDQIDLYAKVQILNSKGEVLFTLPPMFTRTNEINKVTDKADQVITRFDKALVANNPLRTDIEESHAILSLCIQKANSKSLFESSLNEFTAIMDELKGDSVVKEEVTTTANIADDLDWD